MASVHKNTPKVLCLTFGVHFKIICRAIVLFYELLGFKFLLCEEFIVLRKCEKVVCTSLYILINMFGFHEGWNIVTMFIE